MQLFWQHKMNKKDRPKCPHCGMIVIAEATFCQTCGTRLVVPQEPAPAPILFCVQCGAELREGARFCPKCGQTVTPS